MRLPTTTCILGLLIGAGCTVDFNALEHSVQEARRGLTTHEWREGSNSLKVSVKGKVTLADDESDITAIEPDGFVKIEQRGNHHWIFEAVPGPAESIQRTFTRDDQPLPAGAETHEWLVGILPDIMRQTGIDASARVGRLLAAGGADALLSEIDKIRSATVQRIYIEELLAVHEPSVELARELARLASRNDSSSESERIVEQLVDRHVKDRELTELLIAASTHIRSSSGRVRIIDFIVSSRDIGDSAALQIAESLAEVRSSSDKANGLIRLAESAPNSTRVKLALLDAASTINSSSDEARTLIAIIQSSSIDKPVAIRAAEAMETVRSDSERARALRQLATEMPLDMEVLQAVLKAAGGMSTSSTEQIISSLIRREFGPSELAAILQFVKEQLREGSTSDRLQQRIERLLESAR